MKQAIKNWWATNKDSTNRAIKTFAQTFAAAFLFVLVPSLQSGLVTEAVITSAFIAGIAAVLAKVQNMLLESKAAKDGDA